MGTEFHIRTPAGLLTIAFSAVRVYTDSYTVDKTDIGPPASVFLFERSETCVPQAIVLSSTSVYKHWPNLWTHFRRCNIKPSSINQEFFRQVFNWFTETMGNCLGSPEAPKAPRTTTTKVASNETKTGQPKKPTDGAASMKRKGASLTANVLGRETQDIKVLYTLGRELGRGQFGVTFLCTNKESGEQLACKSIAKRKLMTPDDVEDVRREVAIMHHLEGHPNIVKLVGAYEDKQSVHLVMELCAGGELFDRIIAKGHYTERSAAAVLRTIVQVVEACHSLGVMHRDLKPENFLLASKKEDAPLKATDFGLSVFFKPGRREGDDCAGFADLHWLEGFAPKLLSMSPKVLQKHLFQQSVLPCPSHGRYNHRIV